MYVFLRIFYSKMLRSMLYFMVYRYKYILDLIILSFFFCKTKGLK